ncbi:hypothetical protein SLEP1_g54749 [Rubroshorea leprosula]|uniref:Protein Jade-1 n=1 Tax=Rubroshorea leprosula TaxID=152421 RepID=A0AAV5MDX4_9ROSI|nr:hypothetical protein SLEP1_g54749 [Rubroshorea leprosula]
MDADFQDLPPLKRFRLLQQRQESDATGSVSSCLPAKKRKESRDLPVPDAAVRTYCLPAKKRVWAIQPDWISGKPLSPLDLNVEYKEEEEEEKRKIPPPMSTKEGIGSNGGDDKQNESSLVSEKNPSIGEGNQEEEEIGEKESKETPILRDSEADQESKFGLVKEQDASIDAGNGEDEEEEEDDGIICAICQSTDGDPSDPIVFCDGCDLMVHATCYGNPLVRTIPEGEWFCAQCLASKSSPVEKKKRTFSCCLCPNSSGAMKPTNDAQWAHVLCAVYVPEVFFRDPEGREGIDCSKVPKRRWADKCYICKNRSGCVIECSEPKCPLWFHVTCGLNNDLSFEYREGKKGAVVAGFCQSHTELWKKQQQTGKFKIVARDENRK